MITVRKSDERGKGSYGWLEARYSFSFNRYYDPSFTGFRDLLVLNQDLIEADSGFGTHPHKDMEIITYLIEGELAHTDSTGAMGVIKRGEIQRMSAGQGITHSEINPSKTNQTRLLQIWIKPREKGLTANYENISYNKNSKVCLLVSPDGREGSALINQDFYLYRFNLQQEENAEFILRKNRHAWVQVISGFVEVNGQKLAAGDGAAISDWQNLCFQANEQDSEFILMDLK